MIRAVVLGAPDLGGPAMECWHDDVVDGARALGWSVEYLRVRGAPVDDIVRAAKGADLLLWLRTVSHNPRGDGYAMLRRIEDAGTATVGIHMDLYWGIRMREQRIGAEAWWSAQHVYTADGGPRDWAGRGVNHRWCPPAFGTRYLGHGRRDPGVTARAAFVGSYAPRLHGSHRAHLIAWGRRQWPGAFLHVGDSRRTRLYHRKLNDLFASIDVVLGDSAPAERYWSDRVPRTLGRGGLLAYPRTDGLAEQGFTDDAMLLYDRGRFDQIAERLHALSPVGRRMMTANAIQVVRERHTWPVRLATIASEVLP